MEKSCDMVLGASDTEVMGRLRSLDSLVPTWERRFTQEEDFFLLLDRPFVVEPFEIHHDVRVAEPSQRYLRMIRAVVKSWTQALPGIFQGLSWFFDPKDLFRPLFLQILTARDKRYLYLLRPDLTYRGRSCDLLERGGNDTTPRFSTRSLFFESEVLPLDSIEGVAPQRQIFLKKLFPFTWQGETGRGYFVTGRWLDQEITKLLSRAALAPGRKIFPCLPLRCRFETLSSFCATPTQEGRKQAAAALEAAWPLVTPWADRIQNDLKEDPYREDHPLVSFLRQQWAGRLEHRWDPFRLEPYLNEHEQKEYRYYGD